MDPDPLRVWPNNYGVWVDEFAAMGLDDCIELVWPQAKVYLDSSKSGEKCAPARSADIFCHDRLPTDAVTLWLRDANGHGNGKAVHPHGLGHRG